MRRRHRAVTSLTTLVLVISCGQASDRSARNHSEYAKRLAYDIELKLVPPKISSFSGVVVPTPPCVIAREWSFLTDLERPEYEELLRRRFAPEFSFRLQPSGELALYKYDGADGQSVHLVFTRSADSLRVKASLCVYPS